MGAASGVFDTSTPELSTRASAPADAQIQKVHIATGLVEADVPTDFPPKDGRQQTGDKGVTVENPKLSIRDRGVQKPRVEKEGVADRI